jgi:hypothetical protein
LNLKNLFLKLTEVEDDDVDDGVDFWQPGGFSRTDPSSVDRWVRILDAESGYLQVRCCCPRFKSGILGPVVSRNFLEKIEKKYESAKFPAGN